MIAQQKITGFITGLLAAVAGYCDTVTFISAKNIFSAHVTGNFIVFAYQIISGSDVHAWVNLLTFPVFIISVMTGGWISTKTPNRFTLLLYEGFLLFLAGGTALLFSWYNISSFDWQLYLVVMLIVFAMGLQNAFGKLFSNETYGPTTMMTGNVTQASLELATLLRNTSKDAAARQSLKKLLVTIGGFLTGCLLGAVISNQIGLSAVLIPGLAIIICFYKTR